LRKNLLAYSFNHPDESLYVREFSALIQEDPGNLSSELRRLDEKYIIHIKIFPGCSINLQPK
jgi:predicted transcriptional regulator with HTH domain